MHKSVIKCYVFIINAPRCLPNEHGTHTIDKDFLFLSCLCVDWWELSACEHLATRLHATHTNSV